jgi:hypothetical protein
MGGLTAFCNKKARAKIMKAENAKEMVQAKIRHRYRFSRFFLALIVVLLTSTASGAACVQDALANIDQRIFLVMASGAVYRVINNNGVELAFWLPPVGMVVCDQLDLSGELYYVISNQDMNQTVFAVKER